MPELPEVETVARQLADVLVGRRVRRFEVRDAKLAVDGAGRMAGRVVVGVSRIGKQVVIALSAKGESPETQADLFVCVHLRMTGRLIWVGSPERSGRRRGPALPGHVRAWFLTDGGRLLFIDQRRFGTLRLCGSLDEMTPPGVEPLDRRLTARRLAELIADSQQAIKPWLLRQDRLVGLGNIYASEILFAARLDPRRAAGSLSDTEIGRLHAATRRVLRKAIDKCGTTFSDFQDARGVEGGFQKFLKVYRRDGEQCRRCRATIVRIVQQQRSTFLCPRCQPDRERPR